MKRAKVSQALFAKVAANKSQVRESLVKKMLAVRNEGAFLVKTLRYSLLDKYVCQNKLIKTTKLGAKTHYCRDQSWSAATAYTLSHQLYHLSLS